MNDQDTLVPAIAAVLAAVTLPFIWVFELGTASLTHHEAYLQGTLRFGDVLFLFTGILIAFVYFSLRQFLRTQCNYGSLDVPLLLIIIAQLAFHGMLFLIAVLAPLLGADLTGAIGATLMVSFMIAFGALDLLIAVLILRDRKELPELLMVYGVFSALLGFSQLTVLLSPAALVLLPLCLLVLAIQFLRKPEYTAFV